MIGIDSQVNKNYTIQFNIKSRKEEVSNRQIQIVNCQDVSFHAADVTLNGLNELGNL